MDNSVLTFGVTLLQECGFTPSIISYGCLINLYTKVMLFFNFLGQVETDY